MEALLDFFDPTESQHPSTSAPKPAKPSGQGPLPLSLPPEVEVGNVEYKLKLLNPTASRFEHLVTQMKWRLREGQGEAIYEIGVADNGLLRGLSDTEMDDSIATLKKMADRLGATMTILRQSEVHTSTSSGGKEEKRTGKGEKRTVAEVLIRKVPDDQQFLDVRVAVVGPMDAGKSTLLGVLTQGELDNGRGRARLNLFRHLHEIQSGRTSSIGHEILGFDAKGEVVDYSRCVSAEEICECALKLITFIDLAGHQKYMKTTIFGLTAHCPDYAMLVVGANSGVVGTACDHLGFSVALKVPTFVVVTKADLCSQSQANHTIEQLEQILKSVGCNKKPFRVKTESDACLAAHKSTDPDFAPIFLVSCVTGENLDLLQKFLNAVPTSRTHCSQGDLEQCLPEFQTDEIFNVPEVGTVLGGTLTRGILREGDKVLVGPREDGAFVETSVATIRRNRTPCRMVRARQAATVTLAHVERADVRKGTVLLSSQLKMDESCNKCWQFEADIYMLYNTNGGVKPGFQGTVYVNSIMQNADIIEIKEKESLSAGERACVRFRFLRHPEFLRVGSKILFREGRTKGIGEIKRLLPDSEETGQEHHNTSPNRRKPSR